MNTKLFFYLFGGLTALVSVTALTMIEDINVLVGVCSVISWIIASDFLKRGDAL